MFSPPISMLFPVFWAHLCKIEFLYSMQTWKELCDKMAISWLKLAKTWANWRLSCHMQRFQQPIRSGIPFPQTFANFPSIVLIFSLKCSRPLPQTLAETKRFLWGILSPWYFYWTRKVPNEDHIWWIYEQQKYIKMNLQPHQVPPHVPPQVPHQVLVFLTFRWANTWRNTCWE